MIPLPLARYRLEFDVVTPLHLPAYAGSTLRGAWAGRCGPPAAMPMPACVMVRGEKLSRREENRVSMMLQALIDFIHDVLDPIGIVVGLLVAIPVFWTWWQVVFGERRQRRRWLAEVGKNPGQRPGVLVIDLLPGKSIEASVRHALAGIEALDGVADDRFVLVKRDAPLTPEAIIDHASQIRQAARQLLDAGCDVVHLFHAGPDVSALIAGAELSNGPRVLVYHFEQGNYRNFGPLEPLRYGH